MSRQLATAVTTWRAALADNFAAFRLPYDKGGIDALIAACDTLREVAVARQRLDLAGEVKRFKEALLTVYRDRAPVADFRFLLNLADDAVNQLEKLAAARGSAGKVKNRVGVGEANEIMMAALTEDHDRHGWTVDKWVAFVGCSRSTLIQTSMWKQCTTARARLRRERLDAERKRRGPRRPPKS
jgi:hypothetical protein